MTSQGKTAAQPTAAEMRRRRRAEKLRENLVRRKQSPGELADDATPPDAVVSVEPGNHHAAAMTPQGEEPPR